MASFTFRVNLATPNLLTNSQPVGTTTDEAENFNDTRTTWIPNMLLSNYRLQHGDEFTVTNSVLARYLRLNYTVGDEAVLTEI